MPTSFASLSTAPSQWDSGPPLRQSVDTTRPRQLRTLNSVRVGRVRRSEIDDHAVEGCGQFGFGESAEHGGRHMGEHDPFRGEFPEMRAQGLVGGSG